MGAATSVNTQITRQNAISDIYQDSEQSCVFQSRQGISEANIIIAERSSVGNIEFRQESNPSINCVLRNTFSAVSDVELENITAQFSDPIVQPFAMSINFNTSITDQTMRNLITQISKNTCDINIDQTIRNVNVFIGNDSSTGNIKYVQKAENPSIDCVMENSALVKASTSGKNATLQGNFLMLLVLALAIICLSVTAIFTQYFRNKYGGDETIIDDFDEEDVTVEKSTGTVEEVSNGFINVIFDEFLKQLN